MSSSADIPAPPFARTCQASHLLSRVVQHINLKPGNMREYYEEGIQLHHVLQAFHGALTHETSAMDSIGAASLSSARGICYTALIALYDHHTCAELDNPDGIGIAEQLQMQEISLTTMHDVGVSLWEFSHGLREAVSVVGPRAATPFATECLYSAARQYTWYIWETGKTELNTAVADLVTALRLLGRHWDVSSKTASASPAAMHCPG